MREEMFSDFFQFTLGNVIAIFTCLAGIVALWQKMRDGIENLGERMSKQEAHMGELTKIAVTATVQQHERRLIALEQTIPDLVEMKTDIRWIKGAIERMSGNGPRKHVEINDK